MHFLDAFGDFLLQTTTVRKRREVVSKKAHAARNRNFISVFRDRHCHFGQSYHISLTRRHTTIGNCSSRSKSKIICAMHYIDAAMRLKEKESCVLSNAKVNHSSQKTEVFAKKKLRFFIISRSSAKTSGLFHDTPRICYVFSLLLKRRHLLSPLASVHSSSRA